MPAYNLLNGTYCCENSWLLQDVLRRQWGFEGTVISDWGAMNRCASSFRSGLDVEMPGGVNHDEEYLDVYKRQMKVTVPDKYTGDIMGDLNKRRGRVLGMNPDHSGNTVGEAEVPELEIYGYSTTLRSMTGGSGTFEYEFARYEQAPSDVQEKEIAARASKLTKDEE